MNSASENQSNKPNHHESMDMSDEHGQNMISMIRWTINGRSYPNIPPLNLERGREYRIRFSNQDTQTMHPMDHPMHLHGTTFRVLSYNGQAPDQPIWKDTVLVPAGQYVDIAVRMQKPGDWLLHCHVGEHEDQGLMMIARVK